MKNSRELNAYLSLITESEEWGEPGGDGASVAVPRKLYRVSEIADHMGLTRQTLHNYATIGLITEERRTDGGQRLFDESVFERLVLIQRLKRTHLLHEIRRLLDVAPPSLPAAASEPASAGARSMMERSQDLVSLSHLADETPHATRNPATSLREGEVAPSSEVVSGVPHEPSPEHRERETPADEQR